MHVERFDEYVEDLGIFVDTVMKADGHEHLFVFRKPGDEEKLKKFKESMV